MARYELAAALNNQLPPDQRVTVSDLGKVWHLFETNRCSKVQYEKKAL